MIDQYVQNLQKFLEGRRPQTLIILGSGLGQLTDMLSEKKVIKYQDLGFPSGSVSGHAGELICGRLDDQETLCMRGRFHLYEGYQPSVIKEVICAFAKTGIKNMIVTNAAGSLKKDMPAGSVMMISDHINFSGRNPLVGVNNDQDGPRFPDMSEPYNQAYRQKMRNIARQLNIPLFEGVYLMVLGPNFETAAEIRAFQILGADAVGMSTVPEVLAAVYAGIKVLGFSVITNLGTGIQQQPQSHQETLDRAAEGSLKLATLIKTFFKEP